MELTNKFLTTTVTATTGGVAVVKTGLPTRGKVALIIQPTRTGAIRVQNTSGALVNGIFITIPALSGGEDPLVITFDNILTMPSFIASAAGTVVVTYTVVMVS